MEPMTFATPDGLELDLRIAAGGIEIVPADGAETRVEVSGEVAPGDVVVELVPRAAGGHRLRVEHREGRGFGWRRGNGEIRATLAVPAGTDVSAATGSADLRIRAEIGSLSFKSGSGDLEFGTARGSVDARAASGDVRGDVVGAGLSAAGASGDLHIARVGGPAHARTASGDIEIGRAEGPVDVASASGEVSIGTACTGTVNIRTVSGDIEVGVAPGARTWLDLRSRSGETVSELEPAAEGERAVLEIHASSVSGDVRVTHGAAAVAG